MSKKKPSKPAADPKVGVGISMPTTLRDLLAEVADELDENLSTLVVSIVEPGLMRKAKRLGIR